MIKLTLWDALQKLKFLKEFPYSCFHEGNEYVFRTLEGAQEFELEVKKCKTL